MAKFRKCNGSCDREVIIAVTMYCMLSVFVLLFLFEPEEFPGGGGSPHLMSGPRLEADQKNVRLGKLVLGCGAHHSAKADKDSRKTWDSPSLHLPSRCSSLHSKGQCCSNVGAQSSSQRPFPGRSTAQLVHRTCSTTAVP